MALPIAATPVLTGREAAEFITVLQKEAKRPARLTPTPKLEEACELIKRHAKQRQKRIR